MVPTACAYVIAGKVEPDVAIAFRVVPPGFALLDDQDLVHGLLGDAGNLAPRFRADRLDGLPALPQHDLPLARALDIDRLLDAHGAVLELLPRIGFDHRLIGQFLVESQIELFAGDLRGQLPQRRVRDLILRIVPRPDRHAAGEPSFEIRNAVAGERRDHEGA